MDFNHLKETYNSIYFNDQNNSTYLTEDVEYIDEEYDIIIDEIISEEDHIEDLVYDMLDEGFEPEEIEEIFEEILDEARVDMAARAAARKEYAAASEKSAKEAKGRAAAKERSDKRAEKVAAVKSKVKGAIAKVKEKIGGTKTAVKQKVKDTKQQSHKGLAKYASNRNLMPGAGLKTQSSKGRGELRKAVAKDIKGRVVAKASRGAVKAYGAGRAASQAVGDAAGRAKQSAKNLATRTGRAASSAASAAKSGVKSAVGKAARKVATGAGKVASKLGEEFDIYDLVLEYLCVEGYAEDLDDAESIMAYLDPEAVQEIAESSWHRRNPEKIGTSADPDVRMSRSSSVARNSAPKKSPERTAAEKKSDRRVLYNYYGESGKKTAIERAKKERDAARERRANRG